MYTPDEKMTPRQMWKTLFMCTNGLNANKLGKRYPQRTMAHLLLSYGWASLGSAAVTVGSVLIAVGGVGLFFIPISVLLIFLAERATIKTLNFFMFGPGNGRYTVLDSQETTSTTERAKTLKVRYDSGKTGTITITNPLDHMDEKAVQVFDK